MKAQPFDERLAYSVGGSHPLDWIGTNENLNGTRGSSVVGKDQRGIYLAGPRRQSVLS